MKKGPLSQPNPIQPNSHHLSYTLLFPSTSASRESRARQLCLSRPRRLCCPLASSIAAALLRYLRIPLPTPSHGRLERQQRGSVPRWRSSILDKADSIRAAG
nr:unnamed protein product [Digitaria exilis]